jgi:antitoxin component YwqK of YwqJK toxin-antitoxin module
MKRTLFISLYFVFTQMCYSQNNVIVIQKKTIKTSFSLEVFNVTENLNITFRKDLVYYWLSGLDKIKSTQGSAGGDLLHGKYQYFDNMGNLLHEINFNMGIKEGDEFYWDFKGKIIETIKNLNGNKIYWKFKDGSSTIEWIGTPYITGSVKNTYIGKFLFRSEEILKSKVKNKIFNLDESNKCFKLYYTSLKDSSIMQDEYFEYWENGITKVSGRYEDNYRIGDWIYYNIDGKINLKEVYRINRTYSKNNKLASIGNEYYDNSTNKWVKCGDWIWYQEDSDVIKEIKYFVEGVEQ